MPIIRQVSSHLQRDARNVLCHMKEVLWLWHSVAIIPIFHSVILMILTRYFFFDKSFPILCILQPTMVWWECVFARVYTQGHDAPSIAISWAVRRGPRIPLPKFPFFPTFPFQPFFDPIRVIEVTWRYRAEKWHAIYVNQLNQVQIQGKSEKWLGVIFTVHWS